MDDHPKSIVLLITPFREGVAFKSPTEGAFLSAWTWADDAEKALEQARKYTPEGTEITVDHVVLELATPKLCVESHETDGVYEAEGVYLPFNGACPVQGDGEVDGFGVYYRSRGNGWTLEIKIGHEEPWEYGEWPYVWPEGGWIHQEESMKNIATAVAKFRERT